MNRKERFKKRTLPLDGLGKAGLTEQLRIFGVSSRTLAGRHRRSDWHHEPDVGALVLGTSATGRVTTPRSGLLGWKASSFPGFHTPFHVGGIREAHFFKKLGASGGILPRLAGGDNLA